MNTIQRRSEEDLKNVENEIARIDVIRKNRKENGQKFAEMSTADIEDVLSLTIKEDSANKIITFLACLTAYTDDSQFNISYNAPSSSGKSFIPMEVSYLFPKEDVRKIAYASPTAFFHDEGVFNKEEGKLKIDLERKILIFMDQPHNQLLQHLRPLLSHDEKEISIKITDKSQKHGLRTKNVILRGFPTVIFCTAGLKIDEQESTRLLLLSPEISQSKLHRSIEAAIKKGSDPGTYLAELEQDPRRIDLKGRIRAIKEAEIKDVIIPNPEVIQEVYFGKCGLLKPRHQRDVRRILALIKSLSLLNLWHREFKGDDLIVASQEDIKNGLELWGRVAKCQEFGIAPYILSLFEEIIKNVCQDNGGSATMQEIIKKHSQIYGRPLEYHRLVKEMLPALESAGLIIITEDPNDKRRKLISPNN